MKYRMETVTVKVEIVMHRTETAAGEAETKATKRFKVFLIKLVFMLAYMLMLVGRMLEVF